MLFTPIILVILYALYREGSLPTKCPECWHLLHNTGMKRREVFDSKEKTLYEYGCKHCKYTEWRAIGFKECPKCGGKWVFGKKSLSPLQTEKSLYNQLAYEQQCIICGYTRMGITGFSRGNGGDGGCGGCGG